MVIYFGNPFHVAFFRGNNEYPVPVLTAIGELDGGGISYLRREVEETAALAGSVTSFTKTILVAQVWNHVIKVSF